MGKRIRPPLAAFLFLALSLSPIFTAGAHAQSSAPLYLALGDSLAFGVGADSPAEQGYVGLTEAALKAEPRFAGSGLDLLNLSAPGATSADLLEPDGQLDRALAEIESRAGDSSSANDVAIISLSIGGNDLLNLAEPNAACAQLASSQSCQAALNGVLDGLRQNLLDVLGRLHTAAPSAEIYVLDLYNPYSGSDSARELIASVGVQQVNGVITSVAANAGFGAKLASVFDLFEGRAKQWIAQDGIHPNNDGYRVMAEVVEATIEGRPVSLPADLLATPSDAVATPQPDGGGVDTIVVLLAVAVAFVAGASLSAAYFVMRGRA
jgi:lysophospholipase L1-like esterase